MSEQEQVDALIAAIAKVGADLASAKTTLQTEIDALAATHGIDVASLTGAVGQMDIAVQALAALTPTAPAPAPAPTKPLYVHDVEGDTTGWTVSGFETQAVAEVPAIPADPATGAPEVPAQPAVPAKPLWYFDADAEGGQPTGAVDGTWTPYGGPGRARPRRLVEV